MYSTTFRWGPSNTPSIIKNLIFLTSFVTIFSALTNNLFHLLSYTGPQELLSLSYQGLNKLYLWQPLSYMFVQDAPDGVSIFFLLSLLLNMYFIWILGTDVVEHLGKRHFLSIYFLSGILSGIVAVSLMNMTAQYAVLFSPTAAILAIFFVWALLYPDSLLLLFFVFPIQTKWLLVGILGIIFFVGISALDYIYLVHYFSAVLIAYLYCVIALRMKSPFEFTKSFEAIVHNAIDKIFGKSDTKKSKIYHFPNGAQDDDDAFIDAMLTKISKHGEKSLTTHERHRMEQISKRKMKH